MSKKLNEKEKIDALKYNISRFDHYYASVNFKSSFLVLGNITILGFMLKSKDDFHQSLQNILMSFELNKTFATDIFFIHVLLIAITLVFVLFAIKPYLNGSKINKSLIFFDEIANSTKKIHNERINKLTKQQYTRDLKEQTFILAKGLQKKFLYLNIATFTFIITISLFFIEIAFFAMNK